MFWGVERIYLLGGEPLLHRDNEKIIKKTREMFPDSQIRITTNGLLLPNMSTYFFDTVKTTKSHIEISMYPKTYESKEKISGVLEKYGLTDTTIIWGRIIFTKKLLRKKNELPQRSFANCFSRENSCFLLRDWKLAKCPMMLLIDIFDKKYGINRQCKKDYIDLHMDNINGWEALERLSKVSEMCNYCAENPEEFEWGMKGHEDATAEDWFIEEQ